MLVRLQTIRSFYHLDTGSRAISEHALLRFGIREGNPLDGTSRALPRSARQIEVRKECI